jgi:peroxiredoxin 2/4
MSHLIEKPLPQLNLKAIYKNELVEDFSSIYKINRPLAVIFFPWCAGFVCPIEFSKFQNSLSSFLENEIDVIAVIRKSPVFIQTLKKKSMRDGGLLEVDYPILCDEDASFSKQCDAYCEESEMLRRSVILTDENGTIIHTSTNDTHIERRPQDLLSVFHSYAKFKACNHF